MEVVGGGEEEVVVEVAVVVGEDGEEEVVVEAVVAVEVAGEGGEETATADVGGRQAGRAEAWNQILHLQRHLHLPAASPRLIV